MVYTFCIGVVYIHVQCHDIMFLYYKQSTLIQWLVQSPHTCTCTFNSSWANDAHCTCKIFRWPGTALLLVLLVVLVWPSGPVTHSPMLSTPLRIAFPWTLPLALVMMSFNLTLEMASFWYLRPRAWWTSIHRESYTSKIPRLIHVHNLVGTCTCTCTWDVHSRVSFPRLFPSFKELHNYEELDFIISVTLCH